MATGARTLRRTSPTCAPRGVPPRAAQADDVVRPRANPYELNRILVRNWSLDEFGRVVRQAFGD